MWQQTGSCAEVKPVEQESVSEAQKWIDLIFRAEGSGQCLLQQCQCSRSREPSPVHSQQLLGQLQREFMFLGQENKCCNSWGEILLRRRSLKEPSNQAWSGLEIHLGWSLLHSEVPQGEMFSLVFPLNFSFQSTPAVPPPSTTLCDSSLALCSQESLVAPGGDSMDPPKAFTKNLEEVQVPQPPLPALGLSPALGALCWISKLMLSVLQTGLGI